MPTTVVRPGNIHTSIANLGEVVTVVSSPGGAGRFTVLGKPGDPAKSSTGIGGGETKVFGPFMGTETFRVTVSAGDISVTVGAYDGRVLQTNAVLESMAQKLTLTSPFVAQKPIAELTYADCDSRSFRQIFQVPFSGPCLVRAVYQTDNTSTGTWTNTAFAGGRALTDDNPLDDDGAAASWTAVSGTALSAASAQLSTNGQYGQGKTTWCYVVVPRAIDSGQGGYIVVGSQTSATSKRMQVSAASANYESHVNPRLKSMKYRAYANASGDNVSTNQNAFVNAAVGGSAFLNNYHACAWIEVIPAPGSVLYIANAGDSTYAGYGTNVAVHPMGYSPLAICANLMTEAGTPTAFLNLGSSGKGAAFFNRRIRDQVADTQFKPHTVFLEPFTVNDTFVESFVQAGIALAFETASILLGSGVKQVVFSTVTPTTNETASEYLARSRGNAMIRASGFPVLDIDQLLVDQLASPRPALRPEYTAEGLHYRIVSSEIVAAEMKRLIEAKQ